MKPRTIGALMVGAGMVMTVLATVITAWVVLTLLHSPIVGHASVLPKAVTALVVLVVAIAVLGTTGVRMIAKADAAEG